MIQWHIEITEWAPPVKLQRSVEGDSDVRGAEPRSAENKPFVAAKCQKFNQGHELDFEQLFHFCHSVMKKLTLKEKK